MTYANPKATLTLEQMRAQDAWNRSEACSEEYMKLAKGLPAMIMNSGLMQVLAFLHDKGRKDSQRHCGLIAGHLQGWLQGRFPNVISNSGFEPFMQSLIQAAPRDYQSVTAESLAWLKWLRQMAAARRGG